MHFLQMLIPLCFFYVHSNPYLLLLQVNYTFSSLDRYEHVYITIERVAMVSASDYFRLTLRLTAHGVKLGKIVEVMQAIDA